MTITKNKAYLHTILIYPLVFLFSYILKGKKLDYKEFYIKSFSSYDNSNILTIDLKKFDFITKIKFFFDKNSSLYDKTKINYHLDLNTTPENRELRIFDFRKKIDLLYSVSMLSSRVSNDNLLFTFIFSDENIDDTKINNFIRYHLFAFSSRKIDFMFMSDNLIKNKKLLKAFEFMNTYLNDSKFINFSNSSGLYVLTCENNNKKFDIIWTSEKREIELSEFNKVYDKFGNLLSRNIKISNSPIYALHK